MEEFSASKVRTYNLQPALLESFPADVCPDITSQLGCGHRAKFSPSGGGGGGEGFGQIVCCIPFYSIDTKRHVKHFHRSSATRKKSGPNIDPWVDE